MAEKLKRQPASVDNVKIVRDFLKARKVSLVRVASYDLYGTWSDLKPWDADIWVPEEQVRDAMLTIQKEHEAAYEKKMRATPPFEIWVMAFHTHNVLGSIAHVTHGDGFWFTEEECQSDIDSMKSWIGMGDRSQYRPLKLVNGLIKRD